MVSRDEVERRILWSAEWIKRAGPVLQMMLKGGQILRVEGKEEEVCKTLDQVCGTDYICVYPEKHHAWGMACRVQKLDFASFTIRKELSSGAMTELKKRSLAIRCGGIYPFLTMQMYVDDNEKKIRRIGIMRTTDLFDAIERGYYYENRVSKDNAGDQNRFIYLPWDELVDAGYKVIRYQPEAGR